MLALLLVVALVLWLLLGFVVLFWCVFGLWVLGVVLGFLVVWVFFGFLVFGLGLVFLGVGVCCGGVGFFVGGFCFWLCGFVFWVLCFGRAAENLSTYRNIKLICGDFMSCEFESQFDVIYSSLTFMHIQDKLSAIQKIATLLTNNGLFVLSIDKNKNEYIDMGDRKIKIYPDNPNDIRSYLSITKLKIVNEFETDYAYVMVSTKASSDCQAKCNTFFKKSLGDKNPRHLRGRLLIRETTASNCF